MLRTVLSVLLAAPVLAFGGGHLTPDARAVATAPSDAQILQVIVRYRAQTVRLRQVMGLRPRVPAGDRGRWDPRRRLVLWRRRVTETRRRFLAGPAHHSAWLCIHRYEGAWSDGSPPYYGGLQMDLSFQRSYGTVLLRQKGTADHWTPLEQMWVAENAYRAGRGFWPWPNTARACGLI
jgi:hypothetical protein